MNRIFLGAKRTHHSCLRISRTLLGKALTPARFDMLFVLEACDPQRFGIRQADLCTILGVSGATVSRMLKSLDELGYVHRQLDEDDGRRRVISLTDDGRALILHLMQRVHGSGIDLFALDCALGAERWWDARHALRLRDVLYRTLRDITRAFDDRATLDYDAPARPPP
jgi:DNA-binding MarR family transcriptional regulator